jgi:hypothetical protein
MNIKNTLISLIILTLPILAFAEVEDNDSSLEDMIVISEKVKDCELESKNNCVDKDSNYCLVPITCHLVRDDFELESSEFAFCQRKIFLKHGYKNDQERIQACINDKDPVTQQKLHELKETKPSQKLYQTPENNQ